MRRAAALLAPFFPAALLLLFTVYAGTFAGAASGVGALAGHLALLLIAASTAAFSRDPLRLGGSGSLLPWAFAVSLTASWWLSPVPRAGWLAFLLPAWLLVPRAVELCWHSDETRRQGVWGVSAVVAGVAGGALVVAGVAGDGRAALPLGHHNLLAAWLVTLLPIALLPWRDGGIGRILATAAAGLGVAALLATRSLSAAAAVVVVATIVTAGQALRRRPAAVAVALVAAALLLVPQLPRLAALTAGEDSSFRARQVYFDAGWRGVVARPAFGWGPGATAWTLAAHLRPIPGVTPADEVVADTHSLPLTLAYELGTSGLLLAGAVALFWGLRRRREAAAAQDQGLRRAALFGLLTLAVMSGAGLPLAVTALPFAALIAAGAAQAAAGEPPQRGARWPVLTATAALVILVLPLDVAQLAYDRASSLAEPRARLQKLQLAAHLDPGFPLYRARLAWLDGELQGVGVQTARRSRQAASDAVGVAPLWLVAGVQAQASGEQWSREALLSACQLSPLGALAPFHLAVGEPLTAVSDEWGARAIFAEPLLLAATAWEGRDALLAEVVDTAVATEGVDAGWRSVLRDGFAGGLVRGGTRQRLALVMDGDDAASLSLYAFRRRPWTAYLAPVELDTAVLEQIELVPASGMPSTVADVFAPRALCNLPPAP